jgi:hypothetical protein
MDSDGTLNSKLRVLVAKSYRAEKLYASIRNIKGLDAANVSDMANDIRAREWQRAHAQFRSLLNDALSVSNNVSLSARVTSFYKKFLKLSKEAQQSVKDNKDKLLDTIKREEFANSLNLSLELIKLKARAQANKVIADELASTIQLGGKKLYELKTVMEEPSDDFEDTATKMVMNSKVIAISSFRRR